MALPKRGSDPCHGFVGGFDIVYRGQPRVIMDPTKRDQKDAVAYFLSSNPRLGGKDWGGGSGQFWQCQDLKVALTVI